MIVGSTNVDETEEIGGNKGLTEEKQVETSIAVTKQGMIKVLTMRMIQTMRISMRDFMRIYGS